MGGGYDKNIEKVSLRHSILHKTAHILLLDKGVRRLPTQQEMSFLRLCD